MKTVPTPGRATTWFVLCSIVAMLYFARDFLLPVAMAVFVAFVVAPLVRRLERTGLPRMAATILTTIALAVLVGGIGWVFVGQLRAFAEEMPAYRANVRAKAADVRAAFSGPFEQASSTVRDLGQDLTSSTAAVEGVPAPASESVGGSGSLLQDWLGSLAGTSAVAALVLLLAFLVLLRWEDLRDRMLALAGENSLHVTSRAAKEASATVSRYLRRQLLVNGIHGTLLGLALWWIGVPNPLVWGLFAATLRFVPYLGPAISTIAPIFVSFASSEGWSQTWITAGVLIGLEIVTNNVLEPWLYGASTGISPFALIVATVFWTWIWGPIGLVLSTPLTVCLLVLGRRFPGLHFLDVVFGAEPALSRFSHVYHSLQAGDSDEAWEILRQEAARTSLVEAADRMLLPALGFGGVGRPGGPVDVDARGQISALAHAVVAELEELPSSPAVPAAAGALRVLCLPARDTLDAVAGRLLGRELTQRGIHAACSEPEPELAEVLERVQRERFDVVFLASIAPAHFLRVRSLCKSLLALDPRIEVLVGLFGEDVPTPDPADRLPKSPRVHVASTLAEAIAWSEAAAIRLAAGESPAAA